ncbi:MAG: glycosyltransferase family 2 protein [Candidatus Micrarchaeaceae archaeon]
MQKPYISIIIPTLNEAKNLRSLLPSIKNTLKGYRYEIIIVDKNSTDGTANVAKSNGTTVLYDNKGKGSALIKGFRKAKGSIIISMDADLSHRPTELKLLITAIEAGYDVCMGSRFLTGGGSDDMPAFRRFGNKIFVYMVNVLYGAHYSDLCYGYRSFSRAATKKLNLKSLGFGIETEISIKARKKRLRVIEIPSFEKKRGTGVGNLHSFRDGYIILKTILKNILD